MKLSFGTFSFLFTIALMVACTPPVFEPPNQIEEAQNPNWDNTGNVNASFISTSRSIGVPTNTGSPSFDVSFIATASNIDSLAWFFPGGTTNDSISEVTETVSYDAYGRYDVGLKVFNLDSEDSSYFENFIDVFYKDDLSFGGSDSTSWTVSGTAAGSTVFTHPLDSEGLPYDNWATLSFAQNQLVKAYKNFADFPTNDLVLEFDYKLERIPVIYINNTGLSGTSPLPATYVAPADIGTTSNTRVDSPVVYPREKRFSIEYNDIPIWTSSRIDGEFYEHVRLNLPSLSSFNIALIREPLGITTKQIPFQQDAQPLTSTLTAGTATLSTTLDPAGDADRDGYSNMVDAFPENSAEYLDTDGDGYGNGFDNDDDGDGYLDATETSNGSDPLDPFSVPSYTVEHVQYPYDLNIRNMTIKMKSN